MKNKNIGLPEKSIELTFDRSLNAPVLKILDMDGMFPFYLEDANGVRKKIEKTQNGKMHMT